MHNIFFFYSLLHLSVLLHEFCDCCCLYLYTGVLQSPIIKACIIKTNFTSIIYYVSLDHIKNKFLLLKLKERHILSLEFFNRKNASKLKLHPWDYMSRSWETYLGRAPKDRCVEGLKQENISCECAYVWGYVCMCVKITILLQ